jgi:hypothetical protein
MQNMDAKMMALKALRAKIRKMEMEDETQESQDGVAGDLDTTERGMNNITEDAREVGEALTSADGEDGEKEVSLELELEGADSGTMTDLYKRMAEEFGAMPKSRTAPEKKTFRGGMGNGPMAGMMAGKKRK